MLTKAQRVRKQQLERCGTPFDKCKDRQLVKYSPDQPRDEQGQWTAAGRAAAIAGGVLAAGALAHPLLRGVDRGLARRMRMSRIREARAKARAQSGARLTQPTAAEAQRRSQDAAGVRRRPVRRGVRDRAIDLDDKIERQVGPRLNRAIDKLPPKARREASGLARGGGENPIEFNPFKFFDYFT
jgi:hypothetical protein